MENCKNKTISEMIELLGSLENSNLQTRTYEKSNITDDIQLENIVSYLDKSREIILKFKEFDSEGTGESKMARKIFRRFLGHILRGVGKFITWVGDKLIEENP